MFDTKLTFKNKANPKLNKIYSQELLSYLFTRPYYDINGLAHKLGVHHNTASVYLKNIEEAGILKGIKIGRNKVYVQPKFLNILKQS